MRNSRPSMSCLSLGQAPIGFSRISSLSGMRRMLSILTNRRSGTRLRVSWLGLWRNAHVTMPDTSQTRWQTRHVLRRHTRSTSNVCTETSTSTCRIKQGMKLKTYPSTRTTTQSQITGESLPIALRVARSEWSSVTSSM